MKTIKIIDILVNIANGKEVPNIIIEEEDKHYYDKDLKEYINQRTGEKLFEDGYGKFLKYFLNDTVEIIEDTPKEDKKIEKLDLSDWVEITSSEDCKPEMLAKLFNKNAVNFSNKINEIIDKVNGE